MLNSIRQRLANWVAPEALAATQLPPSKPVKPPKGGGLSFAGYNTTTTASPNQLPKPNNDFTNVDLTAANRTGADTVTNVRGLVRASPELAAAQAAHLRVGIPENYILIARDADGEFDEDTTRLAMQIMRKMQFMPDYENGFSQVGSLRSVAEALGRQMFQTGAMNMELVLDKQRLPFAFQPLPTAQIFWFGDGKGVKPVQRIGGEDIDLDYPTFFSVSLDQDLLDAYPQSPLESAIQPVLASTQFLTDLRRLCARHVYKRYDIELIAEKIEQMIPTETATDPVLLQQWLDALLDKVKQTIDNLGVEQALIHWDFFTVKYIEGDDGDTPNTLETVRDIFDGKVATASKTPLTVLGRGANSAGAADADTLLFMLNVNGMIRVKLMELFSKALTLAVRLMGADATVEMIYDEIELRPKSEIAAYRQMMKEYWRGLLSDGIITDAEFALRTVGQLPPKGYTERSGTYFADQQKAEVAANPDSQTSNSGANRKKAPTQAKGPAK
jgi:hypothetical protein